MHGCTKTVLLDNNMYVMTQAPEKAVEPCFPHGLSIMSAYTEMITGRKLVAIVIKNQTAGPITIDKGIKVTQVVAVNKVPQWRLCLEH